MILKHSTPSVRSRAGFTLVELMVVILIVGILSGIVLTAINTGDNSRAVDAGAGKLRSLFSLARSAAITRQQPTRVLINFDKSQPDRFLRYATIVYLDDDVNEWKVYTDGEYLPDGVYFSPALSSSSAANAAPLQTWDIAIDPQTLSIPPGSNTDPDSDPTSAYAPTGGSGGGGDALAHSSADNRWYAYGFNANGTFANPGVRVVLRRALQVGDKLVFPMENDVEDPFQEARGFVIFRSGKSMFFQDPEQIKEGN